MKEPYRPDHVEPSEYPTFDDITGDQALELTAHLDDEWLAEMVRQCDAERGTHMAELPLIMIRRYLAYTELVPVDVIRERLTGRLRRTASGIREAMPDRRKN